MEEAVLPVEAVLLVSPPPQPTTDTAIAADKAISARDLSFFAMNVSSSYF